jgi:uncharacterized membrane protein YeaQ/YmgE (transglycosylase-associated protein family)
MGIIAWLVVGLIAGWLGGMLTGHTRGLLGNIVLGIVGGLLGGFIGSAVFGWDMTGFNLGSILLATLGAILLVAILRMVPGRQPLE